MIPTSTAKARIPNIKYAIELIIKSLAYLIQLCIHKKIRGLHYPFVNTMGKVCGVFYRRQKKVLLITAPPVDIFR